jgi:hypothetical protein
LAGGDNWCGEVSTHASFQRSRDSSR